MHLFPELKFLKEGCNLFRKIDHIVCNMQIKQENQIDYKQRISYILYCTLSRTTIDCLIIFSFTISC